MQKHFENEHPYNKYKESAKDMYGKMKRAAFIRYYLAGAVGCIPQKITTKQLYDALFPDKEFIEKCKQDIKTTTDNERITFIKDLLKNISQNKWAVNGRTFECSNGFARCRQPTCII